MRCGEVRDRVAPYVDGALDGAQASQVRDHLAGCPACRDLVDTARRVGFAPPPPSPSADPLDPRMLEAIIAGVEAPPTRRERVSRWLNGRVEVPKKWLALYVVGLLATVAWGAFGSCAALRPEPAPLPTSASAPAPAAPSSGTANLAPAHYRQLY